MPDARLAVLTLLLLGAAACSGPDEAVPAPSAAPGCDPGELETLEPGVLTLATGPLVFSPWVNGGDRTTGASGDPRQGRGFEAALAADLAQRLGYADDAVTWTSVPFADSITAGPKAFDVAVNQVTIRPERREQVDLTVPYYVVRSAVVTVAGRELEDAADLADLAGVPLAVVEGTDSQEALRAVGADGGLTTVVPDQDAARAALTSGRVEGIVVDLTTAALWADDDALLVDGVLVGQLPRPEDGEEYGMVLPLGSPLTPCVDAALVQMREDGTLDDLERRWLVQQPEYPVLE